MQIAHIVCTYPPYKGGMGNSVLNLCNSLEHNGYKTTVFTPLYIKNSDDANDGESVIKLSPLIKIGNAAFLPQLIFALKKFDIIHLHYPFFGTHLPIYLACKLWHIPLVLHYHMDTDAPGIKGAIFKFNRFFVEPLLLKQANIIIGSSKDYLDNSYISKYTKVNFDKSSYIPFGVRQDLLAIPKVINKTNTILFVGGLDKAHYFKGLNILFIALAKLKMNNTLSDWKLEVIGDGNLKDNYSELCKNLQIDESVEFLGKLNDDDLKKKYQESGFLVLPSTTKGEAFGLVLIESMISGTPVIASDLPGVRSVFINQEHGILVEPSNPEQLAMAMLKMITDTKFRIEAGIKSRHYAIDNYSQKKMADRVSQIYQTILQK